MLNLPIIITPIKKLFVWSDKFLNGGNLFTTPFNWIFRKIQFVENCQCKFHFCRHEIDYKAFALAYFCRQETIWVRMTGIKTGSGFLRPCMPTHIVVPQFSW